MKTFIYGFLGIKPTNTSAFSKFFTDFSSSERKRIVKRAINDANKEQKSMVDKYRRKNSK